MLQGHPQSIAEKSHQDVRLDPRLLLMEQRPNGKLALECAKRGLGFGQLVVITVVALMLLLMIMRMPGSIGC
jgi:hypothetical protein